MMQKEMKRESKKKRINLYCGLFRVEVKQKVKVSEFEEEGTQPHRHDLQRVHVIEGMIQLLTGSLIFQLLIVQFVCRGSRWRRR